MTACINSDDAKTTVSGRSRFEYRVWGECRKARKMLQKLADHEIREEFEDCYLLVDDPTFNAKVRDNVLKVKELVAERKGFERWASEKYRSSNAAPMPFDVVYDNLDLDRLRTDDDYGLREALEGLDPALGVRPLFVTKRRRRYVLGDLKAEVTDIDVHESDDVLRTLSIEGDDLKKLVKLRKRLGIKGEENTPVHQAIDLRD